MNIKNIKLLLAITVLLILPQGVLAANDSHLPNFAKSPIPTWEVENHTCVCVDKWITDAKKENLDAIFNIGSCLVEVKLENQAKKPKDENCIFNNSLGISWLTAAATRGYPPAQTLLGVLNLQGLGVAKNPSAAADWWERAAQKNYGKALYLLGNAFETGVGRKKDLAAAKTLYQDAALAGDAYATDKLLKEKMNEIEKKKKRK